MNTLLIVLLFIGVFAIALCGVALMRNNIVYRSRSRRIEVISEIAQKMIWSEDKDTSDSWNVLYKEFEKPTYDQQMYMLGKWSYDAFYPNEPNQQYGEVDE
jgi:hypothetical protein